MPKIIPHACSHLWLLHSLVSGFLETQSLPNSTVTTRPHHYDKLSDAYLPFRDMKRTHNARDHVFFFRLTSRTKPKTATYVISPFRVPWKLRKQKRPEDAAKEPGGWKCRCRVRMVRFEVVGCFLGGIDFGFYTRLFRKWISGTWVE